MANSPFPDPCLKSGSASRSTSTSTLKRDGEALKEDAFAGLPSFDPSKFQPPAWANDSFFTRKNGESSKSNVQSEPASRGTADNSIRAPTHHGQSKSALNDDDDDGVDLEDDEQFGNEDDEEEEEDVWSDARSVIEPDEASFTLSELKALLSRAMGFKERGNKAFTYKPPKYEDAIQAYKSAIDHLPNVDPPKDARPSSTSQDNTAIKSKLTSAGQASSAAADEGSGIQEVTDEEAAIIEREIQDQNNPEVVERRSVESDIRETTKACWGNLAACYIALKEDQKAVEACTEALKIDPKYVKGLHRRATANERIGSLTALSSAKEDYTKLQNLLPSSSLLHPSIRKSLATLPDRIKVAEKESMDEMMGKLKDLGNMFLGNFGLSTDNFKFEKGDGGGYNMQFQR
ncbi:hypothetical protein I316_02159 [Kwoniella heveanensis BCC8398]|uniref:Uncharacterized protein n=1 Tax=Kwoniella heveanensis BCC8398 TaxID=1296120 RepID=A0A1B9GZ58_9TREE|nr:hypothetical protein I316_02159 [Kwoniella heveanensis BCC8398]